MRFTGASAESKRARIAETLRQSGDAACLLSAPESIAWLLNIRGGDVPNSPLALGFAILYDDARVDLFMDAIKLDKDLGAWLGDQVAVRPPGDLGPALDGLAANGRRLRADPAGAASWVFERVAAAGGDIHRGPDPCALPKACKSDAELDGARAAHLRDGAALTRFLHWFDGRAHDGGLSEIEAADHLQSLRAENELFRGLSFRTIAGSGAHGAIVHYGVTEATNRRLEPGELFLLDSGGQYLDGTTDVTRTLAVGEPSADMRRHFTAVLKGHIALGSVRFPAGTSGHQLDCLARQALWRLGADYDHGTGHGVGSYLCVHEGPQGISKRPNTVALRPGMIVSNEPGYYAAGAYGIRIENLVCVIEAPGGMLAFETLTRAPLDRKLIDSERMTGDEIAWLDDYHATVRQALTPLLEPPQRRERDGRGQGGCGRDERRCRRCDKRPARRVGVQPAGGALTPTGGRREPACGHPQRDVQRPRREDQRHEGAHQRDLGDLEEGEPSGRPEDQRHRDDGEEPQRLDGRAEPEPRHQRAQDGCRSGHATSQWPVPSGA
ncbi:MAG: M24 family metallopeptidase [Proteobacteria bacterium]|nr:M24 family metallopeptidase [Pseudomonadota bacterium]